VKSTDQILTAIVKEYAPYDTLAGFGEGFAARQRRNFSNPYDGRMDGMGQAQAQAFDRGLEAASRYARAQAGLPY
jgi:hypothetical protein